MKGINRLPAWEMILPCQGGGFGYIAFLVFAAIFMVATPFVHAQQEESLAIDIAAQPLADALKQLGRQTSLQIFFTPALVAGKSAQGVKGRMPPRQALDALLRGTGLEYRQDGTSLTLHRRSPAASSSLGDGENPVSLRELVIKEVRQLNYTAEEASSATRIPAPIQDIPRSIGVVTNNVIEDQKAFRIDEAIRNISGTSMTSTQGGRGGDFMIRGFRSDLNVFKNGFREDSTYGARAGRDTANIESIEVVKGPPSYLYGRSDPGGIINQITKAPLANPYYSAQMVIGNFGLYRPTIDIGGPLNESKSLTYRLNAVYENAHSYRNGVRSERVFIAPTIGWVLDGQTSFRLEGEYLYDKSPIDRGIVAFGNGPAPIPVSRFLGDPGRRGVINQGKATLTFLHQFNDSFRWRTAFRAASASERYTSLESNFLDETTGILNLARYEIPQNVQSHYLQNELHGVFSTGLIKHKALVGLELGREFQKTKSSGDFGQLGSFIDIFNPANRLFLDGPLTTFNDSRQTNNALGLYFGDQIALLNNLHMHAGGRFDIFEQNITNRPNAFLTNGSTDRQTDRAFSPSVGMTYQPWKPVALFANYTQSFAPQAGGARSAQGTLFRPERGESYEGGVKLQTHDGQLRLTVAVFETTKKNVLTSDISQGPGSGFSVATGEQRSRGVEVDLAGQILPGLEIIASYAYIDARITKDATFLENSRLPNVAKHQASLWTTYTFNEGIFKGFGVSTGFVAFGERNGIFLCQDPVGSFCQDPFTLPGYMRMDAAVYYRERGMFFNKKTNLVASVNIRNLLNERYFIGAQNFREIIYTGAPLTVIGSLKLEF
ncbi:TonB-dependent receptor [Nitrosospira sp. NpAV]|uniref:TonB-dependent siderophore receptor n=1 Tax=Nitrosospira sp. NpAV TaxID=58133 RepID=UPI000698EB67|nr:TonB-dependent receptor [Nitrosospira sp. NpAV]